MATDSTARHCPTCPTGTPNPANFGGMCDPCNLAATERRARHGALLAAARKAQGIALSHEDRVIIGAGQRAEAVLAR